MPEGDGKTAHQSSSTSVQPIWKTQYECLKRAPEHKNRFCPVELVTKAISWWRREQGLWALLIQLIRGSSVSLGLFLKQSPSYGYEPEERTSLKGQDLASLCKTGEITLALQLCVRDWLVHLHAWRCQEGVTEGEGFFTSFHKIVFFPARILIPVLSSLTFTTILPELHLPGDSSSRTPCRARLAEPCLVHAIIAV